MVDSSSSTQAESDNLGAHGAQDSAVLGEGPSGPGETSTSSSSTARGTSTKGDHGSPIPPETTRSSSPAISQGSTSIAATQTQAGDEAQRVISNSEKPYSAFPLKMKWFIVVLVGIAAICKLSSFTLFEQELIASLSYIIKHLCTCHPYPLRGFQSV